MLNKGQLARLRAQSWGGGGWCVSGQEFRGVKSASPSPQTPRCSFQAGQRKDESLVAFKAEILNMILGISASQWNWKSTGLRVRYIWVRICISAAYLVFESGKSWSHSEPHYSYLWNKGKKISNLQSYCGLNGIIYVRFLAQSLAHRNQPPLFFPFYSSSFFFSLLENGSTKLKIAKQT